MLEIVETMFTEYRDARDAPPPLRRRMVIAGMCGAQSGKGFYDNGASPPTPSDLGI